MVVVCTELVMERIATVVIITHMPTFGLQLLMARKLIACTLEHLGLKEAGIMALLEERLMPPRSVA